ncbi:MAG: homoserine kinase [Actinomycetes bacterium]
MRPTGRVTVRVPASSANLGPGYDAVGLALGLYDEVEVAVSGEPGARVVASGEGADVVPDGEEHLVVRSIRAALAHFGARERVGLDLVCRNAVPHGRGLGSSATAIVTGVAAARALLPEGAASVQDVVHLASDLEGHPDNAAASVLGGMTLGWREGDGHWRAVRLDVHPDVEAVVCVPAHELSTARARAMLPEGVSHGDAAFTAGRAALLVEAMTRSPHLLLAATEERLHQTQRGPAMPETLALVRDLRRAGLAATVSGAGPSVLVLTTGDRAGDVAPVAPGWQVLRPGIDRHGATVTTREREPGEEGSRAGAPVLQ